MDPSVMSMEKNSCSGSRSTRVYMSMMRCVAKAKSILTAIKSKSEAVKARLLVLSLVRHKLRSQLPAQHHRRQEYAGTTQSLVLVQQHEDDEIFQDQQYLVADQLVAGGDPNASVIDLVRYSKEEEGENFSLEAEIDHVADLFILKFHNKMRLQKLESFKRYQQMLDRGAA